MAKITTIKSNKMAAMTGLKREINKTTKATKIISFGSRLLFIIYFTS